nr:hypothetical protein [uncultured Rhodopila sp.]
MSIMAGNRKATLRDRIAGLVRRRCSLYGAWVIGGHGVDKNELTEWALRNGWQLIAGCPSLTKPSRPQEAIVRIVFKTTVANLEVKKPAGKWEKVAGQTYAKIQADADTGLPLNFGLDTIPGFTMLMRENKDRMAFAGMSGTVKE